MTGGAYEAPNPPHRVSVLGSRSKLVVSGSRDQRVAQIADRQRGRVSREQLLAAGITRSVIRRMLGRGHLLALHQGVYAVSHLAPVPLERETAALLSVPGGALSHVSAAILWSLLEPDFDHGAVDVLLPHGQHRCRPGMRVHRTRVLEPGDVRIHNGLPVTSPARTLLDIAELVSTRRLERALEQAFVTRIVHKTEIQQVLARCPARAGRTLLSSLIEAGPPGLTRSKAEECFVDLIRQSDLPMPEINVHEHGFELDFWWRRAGVVVEIDGYQFHGTRRAFEYDRRKDAKLAALGLTVIRFTWNEIVNHPLVVVARLARALAWGEQTHTRAG